MNAKRMKHPVHGYTHAFDTQEYERLKLWGWVDDVEPPEIPRFVSPTEDVRRGPGRPRKVA